MIFKNSFDNLTEEDAELLDSYFDGYDYQSSGHTLIANYVWKDTHNITWEVIGKYLCMAGMGTLETDEKEYFMSFPLTRDGRYDADDLKYTIDEAREKFRQQGAVFEISLIPSFLAPMLKELYGDEVEVAHDRDDDDYVYLREELVSLSGRKLHQKKNHLNYFKKNYSYEYEEIGADNLEEVREFLVGANSQKEEELSEEWRTILRLETVAIIEMLNILEGKSLISADRFLTGAIRIDGEIQAVTIGEFARTNSKDTVLVHVEKANPKIRGLYQAINQEFCSRLPEETVYVNREEDMGMENLRQTKLAYKPALLSEKYSAVWKC